MNLLKEVLRREVFPALGCTEPIAVALAASAAAAEIKGSLGEIAIIVDPGVYKNGLAVAVPNTGGEKGNLIAGVLGALIQRPDLAMEVLGGVRPGMIKRAIEIIRSGKAAITYDPERTDLYIEVLVKTEKGNARSVVENGHTNLTLVEKNGAVVFQKAGAGGKSEPPAYKTALRDCSVPDLIDLVEAMDAEDYKAVRRGVEMNLKAAESGRGLKKVGHYVSRLVEKGLLLNDVVSSSKVLAGSATDARMAGLSVPVMSSGGSGNQGIVAILVPYNVGRYFKVEEQRLLQSIALSHLTNGYIKCFTGDLSPLCGCAISAGVGAAVAVVYQLKGRDLDGITLAVNSLISDLGGMLCDGAKAGCALKVVSSTDSAIRAAYMALNGHGIRETEGFVGATAEETIRNFSRIGRIGMAGVDAAMLEIMKAKMV
ncbi:MAG: serine dehydratase subunit alpha family protein [Thermodesulfobacteriota bacterium]